MIDRYIDWAAKQTGVRAMLAICVPVTIMTVAIVLPPTLLALWSLR